MIPPSPPTPIVLAAGASSRMGSPKAGLVLSGRTALRWILDACARQGLATPIVVAGAHPDAVRAAASGASPAPAIVVNDAWAQGRATSIQAGLRALSPHAASFLLWPVDVPLAGERDALSLLLRAFVARASLRERGWVPSHDGRRGHPVLLERGVARELLGLSPDAPARDVIRGLAERGELVHVPVLDPAVLWDMDSPEDHERLAAESVRRAAGEDA